MRINIKNVNRIKSKVNDFNGFKTSVYTYDVLNRLTKYEFTLKHMCEV